MHDLLRWQFIHAAWARVFKCDRWKFESGLNIHMGRVLIHPGLCFCCEWVSTKSDLDCYRYSLLMPSHTYWLVVPGKEGSLMGPHMYFFKQSTPAPNRRKPPLKASLWANLWRDEWPNRDLPSSQAAASGLRDEGPGLVWPLHRPGWAWRGNLQPGFHFHKKMLLPHWLFETRLSDLAKFYRANLVEVEVGSWMRMGGWGGAGGGRCNFGSFHFLQCCPFPPSPAAQTHTHRNRHSLPILKLFSANIKVPDIWHVSLSVNLHFSQKNPHPWLTKYCYTISNLNI